MTANTVSPSQTVTKNHPAVSPAPTLRKDEIVRRLREMLATNQLSARAGEGVLAAIHKLEMQP
jgi:hypothetical protein